MRIGLAGGEKPTLRKKLDSLLPKFNDVTRDMAPAQLELFKFSLCKQTRPTSPRLQVSAPSPNLISSHLATPDPDVFLPVYAMLHYGDPEWYEKWVGPLRSDFRKDDTKQVRPPVSLTGARVQ